MSDTEEATDQVEALLKDAEEAAATLDPDNLLPTRVRHAALRHGIFTKADLLVARLDGRLGEMRGIGKESLRRTDRFLGIGDDAADDVVVINLEKWSRGAEVKQYAEQEGVTLKRAIEQLVNHGLSHPAPVADR